MEEIFVTGFAPFRGKKTNLSWEVARAFEGEVVSNRSCKTRRLPVSFSRLAPVLRRIVSRQPRLLLMLGESRSEDPLRWEQLAVNVRHSRGRDNDGRRVEDRPVVPGAPLAYRGTLSPETVNVLRRRGDRAVLSFHGGTFCCNQAYFLALHQVASEELPTKVGFLHLPCVPSGRIPGRLLQHRIDQVKRCLEEFFKDSGGPVECSEYVKRSR